MKKSNFATGLFFLALSTYTYLEARGMVGKLASDELGPGFWPKILSVAMIILSVILIVQSLMSKQPAASEAVPFDVKSEGFRRVAKISALMVLFGVVIYAAGIYVGMLVMLPLCMFLHGERDKRILFGLTAAMIVFIYLTFGIGLKVPLPEGLLGNYLG